MRALPICLPGVLWRCLTPLADMALGGEKVASELNGIVAGRGVPQSITDALLRSFAKLTTLLPVLTVVPGFVAYPPELSYPATLQTNEPAVVLREKGKSRLAYFSGDIEPTMWQSGHTDLSRLLQNSIRWVAGAGTPVTVEGKGLIETFAWETEAGFAVHVLNYTNPNAHRGWFREFFPIGEQRVRFQLPAGRRVTRVELLCAERDIPFHVVGDSVEFTIPAISDYEIAALYSA